ncbi:hypothetical protein [Aeromonas encheleia]
MGLQIALLLQLIEMQVGGALQQNQRQETGNSWRTLLIHAEPVCDVPSVVGQQLLGLPVSKPQGDSS